MRPRAAVPSFERQEQILRYVEQRQRVSLAAICAEFGVSPATARRDLDALAGRGAVQRVHGGALAVRQAPPELPALQRAGEQAAAKERIGAAAAALIESGETVFISSGTTALAVARHLRDRQALTVVTNSLLAANALADAPGITLVTLGGMLRRSEMSFIGHLTEQALSEIRVDKIILGIRAIDIAHGLTNDFSAETRTDREILKLGRELIIVADHTKCGRVAAAYVAPLSAIHTLVTDSGTPPEFTSQLEARGVRVIVA
jgi:DeoR/GlpR family transcriptional regulator of sugar metabolism